MRVKLLAGSLCVGASLAITALVFNAAQNDDSSVKGRVTESYDDGSPYLKLNQVAGVSIDEQREAETLLRETRLAAYLYSDIDAVEALGYKALEPTMLTGYVHYINIDLVQDEYVLDPKKPESFLFTVDLFTGEHKLAAVMYMLGADWLGKPVPTIGGELIPWHAHENLCAIPGDDGESKVIMSVGSSQTCTTGSRLEPLPMIHVWVVPHPCGPFADFSTHAKTVRLSGKILCDKNHSG